MGSTGWLGTGGRAADRGLVGIGALGMQRACLWGPEQGGKSTRGGLGSPATGLSGRLTAGGDWGSSTLYWWGMYTGVRLAWTMGCAGRVPACAG